MIDVGEDVRNIRKGDNRQFAKKILQKEFMKEWLIDNQQHFNECMELLRDRSPSMYVKFYLQAQGQLMPKQADLNVKIGIEKDFADVDLLVRSNDRIVEQKENLLPERVHDSVTDLLPDKEFAQFEDAEEI